MGACKIPLSKKDDEIIVKSKKPVLFPRRVGTSNSVTIPTENIREMSKEKPMRRFLVDVFTMRGEDGTPYLVIRRVKTK